jgi:hypothetical protein
MTWPGCERNKKSHRPKQLHLAPQAWRRAKAGVTGGLCWAVALLLGVLVRRWSTIHATPPGANTGEPNRDVAKTHDG